MPEPTEMEIDSEVVDEAIMHNNNVVPEDEENVEDLLDLMDNAKVESNDSVSLLKQVTESSKNGPKSTQIKEKAVYELTRAHCKESNYSEVVEFLESSSFFRTVNKAKCAKVVRP